MTKTFMRCHSALAWAATGILLVCHAAQAIEAPGDLISHSQPGDSRVILSWTPVSGAVSYRVYRGTVYGSYTQIAAGITGLSYADDTFPTDSTVYYVVRSYNGTESADSNAVSFTPQQLILNPGRIVIIVNDALQDSVDVGNYYAAQRGVPAENICHVTTVTAETCNTTQYNALAADVETFLDSSGLRDTAYCLLTTYGIPLKLNDGSGTAVDNMLATIRAGVGSNDYYLAGSTLSQRYDGSFSVYMVTRLDGASKAVAQGLVDKALAAEADANFYSSGIGVFDARRHPYSSAYTTGDFYSLDACLAARRIGLDVYLDDDDGPILEGAVAQNVILYWGWYTHYYGAPNQNYPPTLTFGELQDPFTFADGAVAVHLESGTCASIRDGNPANWAAHYWVPWLINQKGVAASGGAVNEPFLSGYCNGGRFVDTLTRGYSFAEAAYISTPGVNWMMCYVGDPLYTPFGKRLANHRKLYGRRVPFTLTTSDSRYDEIGADAPDATIFNTTFGIVHMDHWADATEHRYVLDYPTVFQADGGPVPSGAGIVSARLLLRAHQNANSNGPLSFRRITDPDGKGTWKQSMADTADNVGVSWAWRDASAGIAWDNASTQGGTLSAGDIIDYGEPMSWRKLVDADVTVHAQAWADGAVNQGWMISLPLNQGDSFWGGDYTEAPVDAPMFEIRWNAGPVAEAGDNLSAAVAEVIPFDGSGSYDPDYGPNQLTYSWDFDDSDGIQVDATGVNPTHAYGAPGTYTVTLTVSDGMATAQDTLSVDVSGTDGTPPAVAAGTADLAGTVSDDTSCPTEVVINGSVIVPVSVTGLNGTWTAADIDYAGAGGTLTLTAEDAGGNTRTVEVTITE
ncbi:MAG: TIGR03790 family protein [Planctomycetes bacterium]|nr:TIGR03790 family protein [Planctomycetota bacterium]